MFDTPSEFWRKCSTCKKQIPFGASYYVCSVSTCNGQRTGYVFCSIQCFESHLPGARHREAGAIEKTAPFKPDSTPAVVASGVSQTVSQTVSHRILVRPREAGVSSAPAKKGAPQEVLIVASRLKEYIQFCSDFNTSGSVMDVLSVHVRALCDRAIENARSDGRKTVLDRDFDFLKRSL